MADERGTRKRRDCPILSSAHVANGTGTDPQDVKHLENCTLIGASPFAPGVVRDAHWLRRSLSKMIPVTRTTVSCYFRVRLTSKVVFCD
jgi:hypothetical protein